MKEGSVMETTRLVGKTNNGDAYLENIRRTVMDYFSATPGRVYLFGSWARGTQRCGSDVDIAIDGADAGKIGALRELLEESPVPYRVDVVDMRFASESLLREIRKDGIRWI